MDQRKAALIRWIILMIMSFPVIATISEDALRAVPQDLREASLGLGATKWQTTRYVSLPNASSRIVTAILLAFAAAMGEMVAINYVLVGTFTTAELNNLFLGLNPIEPLEPYPYSWNNLTKARWMEPDLLTQVSTPLELSCLR